MVSHEMAERAYVQSMIELADARHAATIESLRTDVDRLRDNWAQSYSEQRRASEERTAAARAETQRYLQSIANGDTAPPQDVAAGGSEMHLPLRRALDTAAGSNQTTRPRPSGSSGCQCKSGPRILVVNS